MALDGAIRPGLRPGGPGPTSSRVVPSLSPAPATPTAAPAAAGLRRFAWVVLAASLVVVAWGAFVRATGSGAGCGSHWPLCNGEVVPRSPGIATLIELSHRLSSGLLLVLVVVLGVRVHRGTPKGHVARSRSRWAIGLVVAEALIGAGLVLFELVAHDASSKRALSMALHLGNTFFLLAALALTATALGGAGKLRAAASPGATGVLVLVGVALLGVGATGSVAALGDTLFPATSLRDGLAQDFSPTAHLFVKLRLLHPPVALATGVFVVAMGWVVRALRPSRDTTRWARTLTAVFLAQILGGLANVLLLAPVPMQLVHLVMADLVWLGFVLLAQAALGERAVEPRAEPAELAALRVGPEQEPEPAAELVAARAD